MIKLQINIVDDWKKHYLDNIEEKEQALQTSSGVVDKGLAMSGKNKMTADDPFQQQLGWLKKTERIIRENIDLFIEGLQEEEMLIPNEFVFNLLIKNERWFISEKNSQIVFEVER